jgi:hypothetical protein
VEGSRGKTFRAKLRTVVGGRDEDTGDDFFAATALGVFSAFTPTEAQTPASIVERLDPALDALVAPDTKVETIHQDDQLFEGPVWHHGAGGNFLTSAISSPIA